MYFAIIGVLVAIAALVTINEAVKTSKQNKKKQESEKAMKLLDDKDEFKKFLDYDNSSKSASSQQQPARPAPIQPRVQPQTRPSVQAQSQPAQNPKQQMTEQLQQRLVELKRMQAERNRAKTAQVVATPHVDAHCDANHTDSGEKYKVEYVPTMHSIGGKSTEGCEDHYHVRYVKIDEEEEVKGLELTALQKAVVYGEVINSPAFKRRANRLR